MKNVKLFACFYLIQVFSVVAQTNFAKTREVIKTELGKSKTDASRLNLLLKLSNAYLTQTERDSSAMDSALYYAKEAESLAQILKNSGKEGDIYLLMSEIFGTSEGKEEEGKLYARKAIDYFSKNGPKKKVGDSYLKLVDNYDYSDTGRVARIRYMEKAIEIFHQKNDMKLVAGTTKEIGSIMMLNGKMEDALKKLQQALAIYKSIGYKQVQEVYNLIGSVHIQLGNYDDGLKYGLMAVKTAEQLNDSSRATGEIYCYVGSTYSKIGDRKKAEEYLRKALKIAEKGGDIDFILFMANNIAAVMNQQNRAREAQSFLQEILEKYPGTKKGFINSQTYSLLLAICTNLKEYEKAAIYSKKLVAASAQIMGNITSQLLVYPVLIKYFIVTKQHKEARKYLESLKNLGEGAGLIPCLRDVHYRWFQVDSAQGNYLSAISHYRLYNMYHDSLYNESKNKEISKLHIQFETEKKEKDIELLQEQGLLQKTELYQASILRNVTLGGVALLVIIIGLLFNRYSLKQKTNKEINQKNISLQHLVNEKEWLLKEVHHRVKNNLQTVLSLLESQSRRLIGNEALHAIQESQNRVYAMSLIHKKLYQSTNVASINMEDYLRDLIQHLCESFGQSGSIRFSLELESIDLDVSQAVPVGLIVNEAITNSIKYAFSEKSHASEIVVSLKMTGDTVDLTISDNGKGMTENQKENPQSLGLKLMKGLTEDIGGFFTMNTEKGLSIQVRFVPNAPLQKINGEVLLTHELQLT